MAGITLSAVEPLWSHPHCSVAIRELLIRKSSPISLALRGLNPINLYPKKYAATISKLFKVWGFGCPPPGKKQDQLEVR